MPTHTLTQHDHGVNDHMCPQVANTHKAGCATFPQVLLSYQGAGRIAAAVAEANAAAFIWSAAAAAGVAYLRHPKP